MIQSNAHTHTVFCDGNNTPEEMVQAAIAKGFQVLGFSGHGDTPFDHSYAMNPANTKAYLAELARLKEQYKEQIVIVAGLEADLFSEVEMAPFAYVIGSCHYVKSPKGIYYAVDNTKEELARAIAEGFGGDADAMVAQYYSNVIALAEQKQYDILGHFDLVRKLNEGNCLFCEDGVFYHQTALAALQKCVAAQMLFEVNTGGIARGYRVTPYPDRWLLEALHQLGGRVILGSDAHTAAGLDCQFAEMEQLLWQIGFRQVWQLTATGFVPFPLLGRNAQGI